MTNAIDFYIPFRYIHRNRLKQWQKIVSWWILMILPTATYFLSWASSDMCHNLLNYILLLLMVVMYYELGYIYNDAITTIKEEHPTMRLSAEMLQYGRQHIGIIYFVRLLLVLTLMFALGYLNQWQEWIIITLVWVLLLQPIFLIYNTLRYQKAVFFYPILVSWRYLSFIWIGLHHWGWTDACFLLLLSYPLEISIERFSMPQHRFDWLRHIIPDEEAKLHFRVIYYICTVSISAIIIGCKQLPIIWILPFAFLFFYRMIIWTMSSKKPPLNANYKNK